jgi:outer membrane protein assembly factor BamB
VNTKMPKSSSRAALLRILYLLTFLYLIYFPSALAEHTRRWRQSTYDDFLKGTAHGVAVRSDGRLELAPKFTLLADADASYLWSVRLDPKGTLYAAGGSPAKVFRFDASGKPAVVFDSTDLSAQAIAFDSKGTLYVGTSPDGKVYRVSSSGEKSVFFDPKTKYIWDLAFAADGTLYVATGDKGQVFAVAPDGKGELFYSSDEAHIRVLAFDAKGNLIAGTEPSGRVLRISRASRKSAAKDSKSSAAPGTEGFVLYETSKREVTSLAVSADGTIYASAIGEKQRTGTLAPNTVITTSQGTTTITTAGPITSGQGQPQQPFVPFPPLLSSSIYRISPDGAPEEVWSSRDDVVYALGLGSDGRLLAGTGNNGALLAIDGRGVFGQLAKAGSAQITGVARNSAGKVFLCTANPGKVFSLGPEYEAEGTYESHSFDAQHFSQWGRLEWWSPPPTTAAKSSAPSGEPRLEFFVRSGNTEDPGHEWSRWYGPYTKSSSSVEAPSARFVQWKAVIHDGRPGDGIDWVNLAYLPRNVAPVIDGIAIQDPGVRAQGQLGMIPNQPTTVTLKMPPSPSASGVSGVIITQSGTPPHFEPPPQGTVQKGYQSVLWTAHDDNDDELRYAVYFRGENEREWKLLKDNLEQKFYSWDTTTFPDGAYSLKIVATDAPSNPPSLALKTERESERFEVDNTPPVVKIFGVTGDWAMPNGKLTIVQFSAQDTGSNLERAQYSVDGGEWILVAPITRISDAPEERYEITLSGLVAGEHTIAVRAFDRLENVGSAKTTFTVPAAKP